MEIVKLISTSFILVYFEFISMSLSQDTTACNLTAVIDNHCQCLKNKDNTTLTAICEQVVTSGGKFFTSFNSKFTSLEVLGSDITQIKDGDMANLTNLQTLIITDSPIGNISESAFAHLAKLEVLAIDNTSVQNIEPKTFENLKALREFAFTHSFITGISIDHFWSLNNTIQTISLAYNQIQNISNSLFNSTNELQTLNLSHNALLEITDSTLSFLTNVTALDLSHNYIGTLGNASFQDMSKLGALYFDNNTLLGLPPALFEKCPLDEVHLPDNLLDNITVVALAGLYNVTVLDLDGNAFPSITADGLATFNSLKEVHLSRLPMLTSIADGVFNKAPSLGKVYLSENPQLTSLSLSLFSDPLNFITDFYINNNSLTTLPDIFKEFYLPALKTVDAYGNPFVCSCEVQWMRLEMDNVAFEWAQPWKSGDTALVCAAPIHYSGSLIYEFSLDLLTCDQPVVDYSTQFMETNGDSYFISVYLSVGMPSATWKTPGGAEVLPGETHDPGTGKDIITVTEAVLANHTVLSLLTIKKPTWESAGVYIMTAINARGTLTQSFTAQPPKVKNPEVRKIGLIIGLVIGAIIIIILVVVVIRLFRKKVNYQRMQEPGLSAGENNPNYGTTEKIVNDSEEA